MKTRTFRGWRVLNTAILLIAFLAPWLDACGPVPGYGVTIVSSDLFFESLFNFFRGSSSNIPIMTIILSPVVCIGGVCILIYAGLNLIAVFKRFPRVTRWRFAALGGALLGVLALFIAAVGGSILWGYWLTWVGLISSSILEFPVPSEEMPSSEKPARHEY